MYKRTIDRRWSFKNSDTKEYTHCYHIYPAMMIPQVARTLLKEYHPQGGLHLLFDPYMGSGTSLVEANIAGIDAIGTDLNPLARFIAKVKTTHYDERHIQDRFSFLQSFLPFYNEDQVRNRTFDRISNYTFWYTEDNLLKLSFLSQLIDECGEEKDFFNIALSEVVREVSFTRNGEFKRYKMSKKQLQRFNPDVFHLFEQKVFRNMAGLKQFNQIVTNSHSEIYDFNTVNNIPTTILPQSSVDMVITSPPYGDSRTTVAYGQFSRWSNEWFGMKNAQHLDRLLMGGQKYEDTSFECESIEDKLKQIKESDSKRYGEVVSFLMDYRNSIVHVADVVRRGGVICYVVGNRTVKGVQIPLDYFTIEMFSHHGFEHIDTIVREIPNKRMPSKNSPTNKAGAKVATMSNEYIVIMRKIV